MATNKLKQTIPFEGGTSKLVNIDGALYIFAQNKIHEVVDAPILPQVFNPFLKGFGQFIPIYPD
jgi:hypothetical protein